MRQYVVHPEHVSEVVGLLLVMRLWQKEMQDHPSGRAFEAMRDAEDRVDRWLDQHAKGEAVEADLKSTFP